MRGVYLSFCFADYAKVQSLWRWLTGTRPEIDIEYCAEAFGAPSGVFEPADIKQYVRERIARTSVTICLVSECTHASAWVASELEESIEQDKAVICMGFRNGPPGLPLPKPALRLGLPCYRWDSAGLLEMIMAAPETKGRTTRLSRSGLGSIGRDAATPIRRH